MRYYLRPKTYTDAHGYGQLSRFLSPSVRAHMDERDELNGPAPAPDGVAAVDDLLTSLLG